MRQGIKCALGQHQYEVYKEEEVKNVWGVVVKKAIISRCAHCGKTDTEYVNIISIDRI